MSNDILYGSINLLAIIFWTKYIRNISQKEVVSYCATTKY